MFWDFVMAALAAVAVFAFSYFLLGEEKFAERWKDSLGKPCLWISALAAAVIVWYICRSLP